MIPLPLKLLTIGYAFSGLLSMWGSYSGIEAVGALLIFWLGGAFAVAAIATIHQSWRQYSRRQGGRFEDDFGFVDSGFYGSRIDFLDEDAIRLHLTLADRAAAEREPV